MSLTTLTKTLTLFIFAFFIAAADNISRTLPDGTDVSALQCSVDIVSIGDLARDVLKKCGEPIKTTQFIDQPGRVWVYQLNQVDPVYCSVSGIDNVRADSA